MNLQLSEHFSLDELTITEHRGLLEKNRIEAMKSIEAGAILANSLLEPIRERFARPVVIHSGFRSAALNVAVGGSSTSQHCRFEAADFHVSGVPLVTVFDWIRKESKLNFGQLILEGWSLGAPFRAPGKCGQVMTMRAGKYTRLR